MARQLDIIIYGLACFDELRGGGYRVLFPDGRTPDPYRVPPHYAALWVRDRNRTATARWPWLAQNNDFTVDDRRTLRIDGLNKTALNVANFEGRLSNLRDSDPEFTLDAKPEAILETTIDRGTLSAHEFAGGMTVVKWEVEAEDNTPIVFWFGKDFVEIPAEATQVVLANAGEPEPVRMTGDNHFLLYRKLATKKEGALAPTRPRVQPQFLGVALIDPAHRYLRPRTPHRDCSGVFAR